jgi:Putative DNA-binding domain
MRSVERVGQHGGGRQCFAVAFSPALLDPQSETPAAVTGPNEKAAVRRYNVYRNNVTVSLIDALAAIFPATQRITGLEFFRAMVRFHIRATPPRRHLCCSSMAEISPVSSNDTNTLSPCHGWPTSHGSSARGSTPITRPTWRH